MHTCIHVLYVCNVITNAVFPFCTYIYAYIHTYTCYTRVSVVASMDHPRDTIFEEALAKEPASGCCISKAEGGATTWRYIHTPNRTNTLSDLHSLKYTYIVCKEYGNKKE